MTLRRHKHTAITVHALRQRAGVPYHVERKVLLELQAAPRREDDQARRSLGERLGERLGQLGKRLAGRPVEPDRGQVVERRGPTVQDRDRHAGGSGLIG